MTSAQQVFKQTELNFDTDRKVNRLEPVEISLNDGRLLKEGKHVVVFDQSSTVGDIRATFYAVRVNMMEQ